MLFRERKRAERSGSGFVLMLLESTKLLRRGNREAIDEVLSALGDSTRDTDIMGWYKRESTIGVIFTELGAHADRRSVADALRVKVTRALSSALDIREFKEIRLSFRVFPEAWDAGAPAGDTEASLYGDLLNGTAPNRLSHLAKRSMDIAGGLLALLFCLPLFLCIAIAIKLTSKGPVFFRQKRIGQFGQGFGFLKFRSMYVDADAKIHQDYVRQLIANPNGDNRRDGLYKLVADPRITPVGRFLRRTSLDEIPQFLNVLKGEMSLVGPRPPLPYEVDVYRVWHKTRLLVAKPGITGLWQVAGRSRVKFDDMVRMDLEYAKSRSLWLDMKILLKTPGAVLSGAGAR
jgi:lipopolysaccharide/colanic/teichoic acid biosynthesis glycosyltransferase